MEKIIKWLLKRVIKYSLVRKIFFILSRKTLLKKTYTKKIIWRRDAIQINPLALLINCVFDIVWGDNKIIVDAGTFLNNVTFFIRGNNNHISIWPNVMFNNKWDLWIEGNNCEINIGKWTTFEDVHIVASEEKSKVVIGEDCMFAYDIDIRSGDSHSILDTNTMKRINYPKDIQIYNKVWVTSHVSILKGVQIGENSVVATRSVVTKPFLQKWVLVWGAPAKILKENIEWVREKI